MAPHTPGVLRFGKLSKKPVAPAGYKNKQCRKQTSVLSGRIVTAYVPLRSATERERAAFLIPCQGLRGFDSISLLTFHLLYFLCNQFRPRHSKSGSVGNPLGGNM